MSEIMCSSGLSPHSEGETRYHSPSTPAGSRPPRLVKTIHVKLDDAVHCKMIGEGRAMDTASLGQLSDLYARPWLSVNWADPNAGVLGMPAERTIKFQRIFCFRILRCSGIVSDTPIRAGRFPAGFASRHFVH